MKSVSKALHSSSFAAIHTFFRHRLHCWAMQCVATALQFQFGDRKDTYTSLHKGCGFFSYLFIMCGYSFLNATRFCIFESIVLLPINCKEDALEGFWKIEDIIGYMCPVKILVFWSLQLGILSEPETFYLTVLLVV